MSAIVTPRSLLLEYAHALHQEIPCILDGNPDSVHQARVATRRIREVLPLTAESNGRHLVERLQDRFRVLGRALGRVRDADVRIVLLQYLESRIPTAAPTLVVVRQEQQRRRLRLVRKLIKKLEADEVAEVIKATMARHHAHFWRARAGSNRWRRHLRSVAADRAQRAAEALHHATGIYFPNRAHAARIAIKKLRYALEIGEATHSIRAAGDIRDLKKTQDVLGDLHDRQALIDDLTDGTAESDGAHRAQINLVMQVLEAEISDLHRRFLSRRAHVLAIAGDITPTRRVLTAAPLLLAAGALAVSSGAIMAANHDRRAPP